MIRMRQNSTYEPQTSKLTVFGVSRERGSSRVWRRLANDELEHLLPSVTDNRRQTRIETLDFRHGDHSKRSRYGPGGESRLIGTFCKH